MRNFIGNLLINMAAVIKFMHNCLMFFLLVGFVLGIAGATMLAFFDLVSRVAPNPLVEVETLKLFARPIWAVVVFVLGSATMWLGIKKMFELDNGGGKKEEKLF